MVALFADVCSPVLLDLETARGSLTFDQQNAHYGEAHELASLILDGFGLRDMLAATAPTQRFAFLLGMNSFFGKFVSRSSSRCSRRRATTSRRRSGTIPPSGT